MKFTLKMFDLSHWARTFYSVAFPLVLVMLICFMALNIKHLTKKKKWALPFVKSFLF